MFSSYIRGLIGLRCFNGFNRLNHTLNSPPVGTFTNKTKDGHFNNSLRKFNYGNMASADRFQLPERYQGSTSSVW